MPAVACEALVPEHAAYESQARAVGCLSLLEARASGCTLICNGLVNRSRQTAAQLVVMTDMLAERQDRVTRVCDEDDLQGQFAAAREELRKLSPVSVPSQGDAESISGLLGAMLELYKSAEPEFTDIIEKARWYQNEARKLVDDVMTKSTQASEKIIQTKDDTASEGGHSVQSGATFAPRSPNIDVKDAESRRAQTERSVHVSALISGLVTHLSTDIGGFSEYGDMDERIPSHTDLANRIEAVRQYLYTTPDDIDRWYAAVSELQAIIADASTAARAFREHTETNVVAMGSLTSHALKILEIRMEAPVDVLEDAAAGLV